MAETGITLAGAGAPYACDLPAMLSAIWFWRASGRLAGETVLRDLDPLPLHGFEWEFEVWDNHLACCDGIVEARIDRVTTGAGRCFVAPLNCSVASDLSAGFGFGRPPAAQRPFRLACGRGSDWD